MVGVDVMFTWNTNYRKCQLQVEYQRYVCIFEKTIILDTSYQLLCNTIRKHSQTQHLRLEHVAMPSSGGPINWNSGKEHRQTWTCIVTSTTQNHLGAGQPSALSLHDFLDHESYLPIIITGVRGKTYPNLMGKAMQWSPSWIGGHLTSEKRLSGVCIHHIHVNNNSGYGWSFLSIRKRRTPSWHYRISNYKCRSWIQIIFIN